MNHTQRAAAIAAVLAVGFGQAVAGEVPPKNAVPMSQVASTLEAKGYSPIVEMSIDKGVWEVEAYKNDMKRELEVDPLTSKILSDRPDD